MKKIYLAVFQLCIAAGLLAQNLSRSPVVMPVSGLEQVFNENPYVVQQYKDSSGNFNNVTKMYWEPSTVPGMNKLSATYVWENNAWKELYSLRDSFVVNSSNELVQVIEKLSYDYPNYSSKQKSRYSYTYNPDKTVNTVKFDIAQNANSNSYSPYMFTKVIYSNGMPVKDSLYYYQQKFMSYILYAYNSSNQIIGQYGINPENNDTMSRTFYTYEGSSIKTLYSDYLDQDTDDWILQNADSMEYTNGKITKRIKYAMVITQGQSVIQPYDHNEITYNQNGSINTIYTKRWIDNEWVNESKTEFTYKQSGKPLIARIYNATEDGYSNVSHSQYVFDFLQSLNPVPGNKKEPSLYPNPVSDLLNVSADYIDASYSVIDITGRVVLNGTLTQLQPSIQTTELGAGTYYLRLTTQKSSSNTKFVVKK